MDEASGSAARHRHSYVAVSVLAAATTVMCWMLLRLRDDVDVDTWLHLRIGEELLRGHRFRALPDPLVVLADRAYIPTQWAAQVAGTLTYQLAGFVGLHALRYVALVILVASVYLAARVWVQPTTAAWVTLVTAFSTSIAWGERPQLAGLALTGVVLWLWSRSWRSNATPWIVVPVQWAWATVHGSWIVGVGIGGLVAVASLLDEGSSRAVFGRRLLAVGLSVAVSAATPLGPAVLTQPFMVSQAARETVNEWQQPSIGNPLLWVVLLMALAAVGIALTRGGRRALPEVLLGLAAAALALSAVRTIAFGAVVAALALARAMRRQSVPLARSDAVPWVVAAAVFGLLPGVVWGGPSAGPFSPALDQTIAALPAGSHVAVAADSSGWVVWNHRNVIPLRDLRVEVYSDGVAHSYEDFYEGKGDWAAYASDHAVAALLVRNGDTLDDAARDAGWIRGASDGLHSVWVLP